MDITNNFVFNKKKDFYEYLTESNRGILYVNQTNYSPIIVEGRIDSEDKPSVIGVIDNKYQNGPHLFEIDLDKNLMVTIKSATPIVSAKWIN